MELTPQQRAIVELERGQHLVLAPPGTGKTELLAQRIDHALRKGHDPRRMVCLTFTNRAARNMRDRIGLEEGSELFVGNIHSFCYDYLSHRSLIPKDGSLLDEEDVRQIFQEIVAMEGLPRSSEGRELSMAQLAEYSARLKALEAGIPERLLRPASFRVAERDLLLAKRIAAQYEEVKRESIFLDFDDLLSEAYLHLRRASEAKQEPPYDWVQVDEVQDLNAMQWAILDLLCDPERAHRVFFGDYEQAIFSFMGAKLEMLEELAKRCSVHRLYDNFRSPSYLLEFFNRYAAEWLSPDWERPPQAKRQEKAPRGALLLRIVEGSEKEETEWILDRLLPKEPEVPTAVLVRNNFQADRFAEGLNRRGLSYFKISGYDLFHRRVVKDLLAFFEVLVDDAERSAWQRLWHLYAKLPSLREAREFVNTLFSLGYKPLDFLEGQEGSSPVEGFGEAWRRKRIVIFDTETTGLDPEKDAIVQIAAVAIEGGEVTGRFMRYLRCEQELGDSTRVHGITSQTLQEEGVEPVQALEEFLEFLGEDVLVAHNLPFDWAMLQSQLRREGMAALPNTERYDSLELSRRAYPGLGSYRLGALLERLGLEGVNSHNAADDVEATGHLLRALARQLGKTERSRVEFRERYGKWLERFGENYTPLYRAVTGEFGREIPLRGLAEMVVGYMSDRMGMKVEPEIYDELEKLLRHMDARCLLGEAYASIRRYIPEYSRYRESDLVLGDERIVVATIHKAKGLEFDNVLLPACTDDRFPGYRAQSEEEIKEEARLLYVGMTRARRRLVFTSHTLSYRKDRSGRWQERSQALSRFLEPLGEMLDAKRIVPSRGGRR